MDKQQIIQFLQSLPQDRRVYWRVGNLMVEITKEEAIKLLKEQEEKNKEVK
ncbi:MAG: hypothetical protein GXO45_00095 [Aquificae bacterium]|nr:hypothetical protein [Aquificota bacterium]